MFRPTWVRRNGVLYQSNNAYLITSSDGLDPVFVPIDDVMVIGGDMVIFGLSLCKVSYFDCHYHAYVVTVTSHQSLFVNLLDHNVYHGHRLADGFTYIALKYHYISMVDLTLLGSSAPIVFAVFGTVLIYILQHFNEDI